MTAERDSTMTLAEIRERLWASRGLGGIELDNDEFKQILASLGAHLAARDAVVSDEDAEFRKWFEGEQGKAYDGMWCFARAAWMRRAALESLASRKVAVSEAEWISKLRRELLFSKITHNFTFTRDEVIELLASRKVAVPDGWRVNPDDSTGFIEVTSPKGETIHIGYFPQASTRASQMLRDLVLAMLASQDEVK